MTAGGAADTILERCIGHRRRDWPVESQESNTLQLQRPKRTWWAILTSATIAAAYWQLLAYFFWWPGVFQLAGSCMESTPEGDRAEGVFGMLVFTIPFLFYLAVLIFVPILDIFSQGVRGARGWVVSVLAVAAGFAMTVLIWFNIMLDTMD